MFGQKQLIGTVSAQIEAGEFPRFSIFVGESGSEKNEFARLISDKLLANYAEITDCKVESVRDIIQNAYTVHTLTVYSIPDADNMSAQARNALLKVTEEPPNKAYFVMTLEDENNTLPTIKSRGAVYKLQPYTRDELKQCCNGHKDSELILKLAETVGDVKELIECNPSEFYAFVEKVVDNIATVSGSNVFKIADSIRFKESDEHGYSLKLFWRAFSTVCLSRKLYSAVAITGKYLGLLYIKSLNRSMLFDRWILDIREDLNGYN